MNQESPIPEAPIVNAAPESDLPAVAADVAPEQQPELDKTREFIANPPQAPEAQSVAETPQQAPAIISEVPGVSTPPAPVEPSFTHDLNAASVRSGTGTQL